MKNALLLIPLVGLLSLAVAQYGPAPPRINIPGAIPLPVENRPAPIPRAQIPERFFATDKEVSSNAQRFALAPERPPAPAPQPKQYRPAPQAAPRPAPVRQQQHFEDDRPHHRQQEDDRRRKPVAQILRKWREEHDDGSITWGFENDDGSFKEETIGIDCVTRGRYGYVDPDGEKREYSYETGIQCDPNKRDEENEEELEEEFQQKNKAKRPHQGQQQQQQPQQFYRN
ncbi:uncharacterized protein LOC129778477 isoform X2 [Toxorhynchites rutilus septentrionalis]|uniref:uncharacterized protein LOC129778477 isoform X2 n=1 Tax=Toxorhynchites rutilus septentrionalis TaxID=329112 RepID=UPI00247976DD|nr:uncharacterized protein LOC129778477 isoform X2 [Toxorhynchites rutilus septentrionalis]